MALSPEDKAYWQRKLGWKTFVVLFAFTSGLGCIVWPLGLYILHLSAGHADQWTWADALSQAEGNFMLAILVTMLMWCIGQVYLYLDWLPPRE